MNKLKPGLETLSEGFFTVGRRPDPLTNQPPSQILPLNHQRFISDHNHTSQSGLTKRAQMYTVFAQSGIAA